MIDINKLIQAEHLAHCAADEYMADMDAWTESQARQIAQEEGLQLTEEHMEVLCWLRDHYAECGPEALGRHLSNALDDKFADRGGLKYLYRLFPKGPVYQGSRLAGLPVPPGTFDMSFGSSH